MEGDVVDLNLTLTLDGMRRRAFRNATKTGTGMHFVGPVTVRYYPRSNRYAWWTDGERSTLRQAAHALTREIKP
jgi:hypothetical protein